MTFIPRQEEFICEQCGATVTPLSHDSYRNHCPKCLHSKHVDSSGPGSRDATCLGLMEPIGIDGQAGSGFIILHQCTQCGKKEKNKAASDDALTQAISSLFH